MRRPSITSVVCLLLAAISVMAVHAADARAELVVQTGHASTIRSIGFTPDGRVLASLGLDGAIKIWDVASGREVRTIGDSDAFGTLALSPDGKTVATASSKTRSVKLYSVATGELLRTFPEADLLLVWEVRFSPDGETIATIGYHNKIVLWNARDGSERTTLYPRGEPRLGSLTEIVFSPDGRYLAAPEQNGVRVWDLRSDQSFALDAPGSIHSLAFNPTGTRLAVGDADGQLRLFDIERRLAAGRVDAHAGTITALAFSPDGKMLATAGRDRTARIWDPESLSNISTLAGHTDDVAEVAFDPTGEILATGSADKTIKLWSPRTGTEIKTLAGTSSLIYSIEFSRDGRSLALGRQNKTVQIWNAESGSELRILTGHSDIVWCTAFSPSGKMLASGSGDRTIRIWDLETGKTIRMLNGHADEVRHLAFSPDGKILASGDNKGHIILWDVATGAKRELSTRADSHEILALRFSPDGSTLATGGWDTLKLWDVPTLKFRGDAGPNHSMISSIAFSRDGQVVAMNGNRQYDVIPENSNYVEESGKIWFLDVRTLQELEPRRIDDLAYRDEFAKRFPIGSDRFYNEATSDSLVAKLVQGSRVQISRRSDRSELASLVTTDDGRWTVVAPDGRFDTSSRLDEITGLHWIDPTEPFSPIPIEIFMRQYYEPGLLARLMRCSEIAGACAKEFRQLPPITEVNRTQPKLGVPRVSAIKPDGTFDVSIDVEDGERNGSRSGVFDLGLFVDRRLVGSSATRSDVAEYISQASGRIGDDAEIWRRTHDLARHTQLNAGRTTYFFRNVRLPRDGQKRFEISAYAFNSDRVKSETVRTIVDNPVPNPVKGNTFLISIGVNASESSKYNLGYAANDARGMQDVLGTRLIASGRETIRFDLVSDFDATGRLVENRATKKIIKGVFDVMTGHRDEVDRETLRTLSGITGLGPVQPEDTVIITFSGHGYTRNGVFYMLPYDIGPSTLLITDEVLPHLISSDELSLWMRDLFAKEILFIVDACHSAASVQGSDFKPGPMGSRGLGQLAYDKGMRVLTAAQTNNVALEIRALRHGLLSYALLEEGIIRRLADSGDPKDGMLTTSEWLTYAVRGVPALYRKVIEGKARVAIGDESVDLSKLTEKERAELFCEGASCRARASVQQPVLFDFARGPQTQPLIKLGPTRGAR